jgi:hypothetical protein
MALKVRALNGCPSIFLTGFCEMEFSEPSEDIVAAEAAAARLVPRKFLRLMIFFSIRRFLRFKSKITF